MTGRAIDMEQFLSGLCGEQNREGGQQQQGKKMRRRKRKGKKSVDK